MNASNTAERVHVTPGDEDAERRRREEIRRRRLLEKQRQERRRQMIQRRKFQLFTGAAIIVLIVALTAIFSSGSSDKKKGEKAVKNVVEPGLYQAEKGTKYQKADGSFLKNDWMEIDGKKYYFGKDSYMTTGWLILDGKEYFFDDDGVYDSSKHRPMVALTYDDGPGLYTEKLLDCLEENDAKATFFMVGKNAGWFPDIVKRMKDSGMGIGNHSFDHTILTSVSAKAAQNQIEKTNDAIEEACGVPADTLRPPGGSSNEAVSEIAGLPLILWSIDTKDWKTRNADKTYQATLDNVKDGSIVLMHDIHESSVEASLRIIPDLIEKGYRLVTVRELAEAKGIDLENGVTYSFLGDSTQDTE